MNAAERSSRRADAVNNRARLLDAALEVFAQAGLDLEVADIATRAQVGVGTLYRHFGNREELLRAIITEVVEDAHSQIQAAIQPYTDDPRSALLAFVSAGLRIQRQYQSIFSVVRDPRLTRLFDHAYGEMRRAQFLDQAQSILRQGIQMGIFRADLDKELAAATIFGAFSGAFELLGNHYPLVELEQRLFQLLWMMVAQPEETKPTQANE